MLKQRVITALILGAVFLLALFSLPDLAWGIAVSLIVVLALHEWAALAGIPRWAQVVLTCVCVAPILANAYNPPELNSDTTALIGGAYLFSAAFWLMSVPAFLYFRMGAKSWYWRYPVAVALMVPAGLAMLELRRADPWLMFGALLVVCAADIAAYFAGRRFGRHKLAPSISPGKTWEGVAGAVLGVLLFCFVVWVMSPTLQALVGPLWVAGFALLATLVSIIGDLFESQIKRAAGVKDSGSLLPGHGGVLDRIDSMLAFFPFAGGFLLLARIFG